MNQTATFVRFVKGNSFHLSFWKNRFLSVKQGTHYQHLSILSKSKCRRLSDLTGTSNSPLNSPKNPSAYGKFREWWRGPTFKYWFIGGSAFLSWLFYYSLKAYRKTRLEIIIPPALPAHYITSRDNDLRLVDNFLNSSERIGGSIRLLSLQGPTGSGKSTLAYNYAKRELENLDYFRFSPPKSRILVFLNASSAETFMPSLKGVASKLGVKPADIKEKCEERNFGELSFRDKCDILLMLCQEKLQKHPNWVLVFDNLQSTTSVDIRMLVRHWFLDEAQAASWSSGTVLLVDDGNFPLEEYKGRIFKLGQGLSKEDSNRLLQEVIGLSPDFISQSSSLENLIALLHGNPLSLVCAGVILKHRLGEQPMGSVDSCIKLLHSEVERNVQWVLSNSRFGSVTEGAGESKVLIALEVLIAMAWNVIRNRDPYVAHCIDILSNGRPGLSVPSLMLLRYLKTPLFQLPPIEPKSLPGLGMLFDKNKEDKKQSELQPVGTPLSNRRIVGWLNTVEDWFTESWQTVKELYELYRGAQNIPEEDDGLGFLRECELLLTEKLLPGDVKSFKLHPCVYMVTRQNLLSSTAPSLENRFLRSEQLKFDSRAWYKKMQPFDPALALEQFRNSLGMPPQNVIAASTIIQGYNAPVFDLSSILLGKDEILRSTFESGNTSSRFRHIQAHLTRVLASLEDAIKVTPQSTSGKTVSRLLSSHLEYMLQSQPSELISTESRIKSLLALAHVSLSVENNLLTARNLYEVVLQLQQSETSDVLSVAHTLTQIANIEILSDSNEKGKELLDQAVEIYESHRKKVGEYQKPFEFGKTLALLGAACGSLGEKQRSKELLERALMLQQAGAPDLSDAAKGKQFAGEFAASLTDLGHAYIAIGLPLYGKKILDLALAAHKNVHGETHPEVSRTLSLLSVAHLMQGHNEESRKLSKEAGKVNKNITEEPVY